MKQENWSDLENDLLQQGKFSSKKSETVRRTAEYFIMNHYAWVMSKKQDEAIFLFLKLCQFWIYMNFLYI